MVPQKSGKPASAATSGRNLAKFDLTCQEKFINRKCESGLIST